MTQDNQIESAVQRAVETSGKRAGKTPPEQTINDAFENAEPVTPTLRERVAELSELEHLDYLEVRKAVAKEFGVPVADLDKAVNAARGDAGTVTNGQGRPICIDPPEPWHEPVDGAELLSNVRDALLRHVSLPESAAEAIALWIVHTHVFDAWRVSPRLGILSPEKGCGKTTLLSVLEGLVCKPLVASNISGPAIFRVIEQAQPCLLVDECDTFLAHSDELKGILNSSHAKSGAYIIRVVGDNHEPRQFTTWAPIALAAIGSLPDTLEDRAIKITMRRRVASERIDSLDDFACERLHELQRKAARWACGVESTLSSHEPEMPAELHNRQADNWRPLLAIADEAGGNWPALARETAIRFVGEQEEQSARVMALQDVFSLFEDRNTDRLPSAVVVDALNEMEDRPWPEWRRGRQLAATSLGRLLKPFGIFTRTIRFASGARAKGYLKSQFEDAISRYVAAQKSGDGRDTHSRTVTPCQSNEINSLEQNQTVTSSENVTVQNPDNSLENNNCHGVTVRKPENRPSGEKPASNRPLVVTRI